MNIFIKILQNNLVEREIKFHVFDTFLRLMPVKSESLKISLQTNIIYVHQYLFFATQHSYYSGITLSNKKLNFFKIIDKPDRLWYITQVFYSDFSIYFPLIKLAISVQYYHRT